VIHHVTMTTKHPFCCLITPPREGLAPETDPCEQHAHNWHEPKAKPLKKKENFVVSVLSGVASEVLGAAH
jgi:hypothetical protein